MTAVKTFGELAGIEKEIVDELGNHSKISLPQTPKTNLLIIDGNNLGYRYLKRKNFNSFQDDYIRTIESLANSYHCKDILVAYDFGKSQYRLNIFPEYKANRTIAQEDKEHYDMFFAELNKTCDELPFPKVRLYGVEADDLIAYFILELYQHYKEVWVISSDRDMYQLLKGNVHIFNMFSRKEITQQSLFEDKGMRTHEHMLAKVIQGDAGDNIKGIEGIGEIRGNTISKDHQGSLEKLLAALPLKGKSKYIQNLNAGADILRRNEKLINLSGYNRQIIGYGDKGSEYLAQLDELIAPYKEYPIVKIPRLLKDNPVDIRSLESLLK
jgi:5'-3' exonuclease